MFDRYSTSCWASASVFPAVKSQVPFALPNIQRLNVVSTNRGCIQLVIAILYLALAARFKFAVAAGHRRHSISCRQRRAALQQLHMNERFCRERPAVEIKGHLMGRPRQVIQTMRSIPRRRVATNIRRVRHPGLPFASRTGQGSISSPVTGTRKGPHAAARPTIVNERLCSILASAPPARCRCRCRDRNDQRIALVCVGES